MDIRKLSPFLSVSPQLKPEDVSRAAAQGFRTIINNRPDGESDDQPRAAELKAAAEKAGLAYRYIPVVAGQLSDSDIAAFRQALDEVDGPALAFCRTGTRSATLWALSEAHHLSDKAILSCCADAGYDLSAIGDRLRERGRAPARAAQAPASGHIPQHDIVIVGGGAAGLASAASLLKRQPDLDILVLEPREQHYYQPGWTLVGGGVFDRAKTMKSMAQVMPKGVKWSKAAVAGFAPTQNEVILEDGSHVGYKALIVAPGLKLDWDKITGLKETLGKNGVTSNYLFDMAPYTWELVQSMRRGNALFTQPPMPIKCAGAPQKAMYLSCDHWFRRGDLNDIQVDFYNAGAVLFGVPDYVPALNRYIEKYHIGLNFGHNLSAVDGASKTAVFTRSLEGGDTETLERPFDMLHVCPPQSAPAFIQNSALANDAGWVDVSPQTLQHQHYANIFSLGDVCSAPNAKTAAAARAQAPAVAHNVIEILHGRAANAVYNGYGSCPLTVERGKIVLAEFGYGGKLLPTFPAWLIDGTKPTRLAWLLKEKLLPDIYWHLMLKGREWFTRTEILHHSPSGHEKPDACDFKDQPKSKAG